MKVEYEEDRITSLPNSVYSPTFISFAKRTVAINPAVRPPPSECIVAIEAELLRLIAA